MKAEECTRSKYANKNYVHLSKYIKVTLRGKKKDTGSGRRKLKIALFGELSLEEAIDLSGDRQILD
jgi:hypothetical protein